MRDNVDWKIKINYLNERKWMVKRDIWTKTPKTKTLNTTCELWVNMVLIERPFTMRLATLVPIHESCDGKERKKKHLKTYLAILLMILYNSL